MGLICLHGGNEFTPACRDLDAYLLAAAGGGPVAVLPLASAPGHEYDTTGAGAVRHFRALGATDVIVADPAAPHEAAAAARLVVLPGGSPSRLRAALTDRVAAAVRAAAEEPGRVVVGASAGAMLLCGWTVLPESGPGTGGGTGPDTGMETAEGLGVVPDFAVVPHYEGPRPDWERALLARGVDVLGIPECSGVVVDGEEVTSLGARAATLVTPEGRELLAL